MENITKINVGGVDYEVRKDLAEKVTALEDKVFPLTISVSGGGTFEKGVPRTITVTWTVKKGDDTVTADSVTVNDESASGTSKQFTNVSSTTTYIVKATKDGTQVQGQTTATFVAPMYFGFADADAAASLSITSLNKQSIKTSPAGTYILNNSQTGNYLWLCVPSSMTINRVTSSGFDIPMEEQQPGSTSVDTYKCYRSSSQINEGSVTIVIS
ncbi:hypothetical protein [Phocaeicola sp.]|uniref:hypothetical protein n=1 Tax=Phocaeicola sp. TaxID=2773926 RepID=UPI003AB6CA24